MTALSYALSAIAAGATVIAGGRPRLGWAGNLASLPLWVGYFAATGQWPFVPLMAVYGVGYVRLLRHATRQAVAAQGGAR